ncbi:MAG TPA: hypothetical protein VFN80_02130 [Acidothermaceae bacterium]|jgi:hypothetical protein|nr:hypothetical protein [Acidothermaceae bacterium]
MPGFDLKQVSRNDKGVVGAGIVALIFSFIPHYYGGSVNVGGFHYSAGVNAWHSYAFFGMLLVLLATLVAAAVVSGAVQLPKLPVGTNLLIAGLAGLGTLLIIIRGFTADSGSGPGYSYGVQWSGYIVMLAGVVETVFAVMNFRASGEKLAWDATAMAKPAAAGGAPVPPPQPTSPTDQPTTHSSDQV